MFVDSSTASDNYLSSVIRETILSFSGSSTKEDYLQGRTEDRVLYLRNRSAPAVNC